MNGREHYGEGPKQSKYSAGGNVCISQVDTEHCFLVGDVRKYTSGDLGGQSSGKAFDFHLMLLLHFNFHTVYLCRQWAHGMFLLSFSCSFTHTCTHTLVCTFTHTQMFK